MAKIDKAQRFYAPSREAWRKWLEEYHLRVDGIWLVYAKKGSGAPRVEYDEAVEEALCFGWIDTTINSIDENWYMQLFTPRKPKSTWSKSNKERVDRLQNEGRMMPEGLKKIEIAKINGSWEQIDHVESLIVPYILEEALSLDENSKKYFHALSNTNKKYILYYINNVKKTENKVKRVNEIVDALKLGKLPERWTNLAKKK